MPAAHSSCCWIFNFTLPLNLSVESKNDFHLEAMERWDYNGLRSVAIVGINWLVMSFAHYLDYFNWISGSIVNKFISKKS